MFTLLDTRQPFPGGKGEDFVRRLPEFERESEIEGASLSIDALYRDIASHQIDDTLADGQTKTGSSVAAGSGTVRLAEGGE